MQLNPFAALRNRSEARAAGDGVDAMLQAFLYGGNVSSTGVRVTPETALASVAVAACIEVRAETFSALPGGVFRKEDRKRVMLNDHPVQRLLFDRPNDLMTSGELWRWKQVREDITGNAHMRVIWKNGRPSELWPLYGSKPEMKISNGKVAYKYSGDDVTPADVYSSKDILHFRGPFLKNPFEATSPIELIKDSIGLSIATEQFFGRFLNNGSHFPTYLETDQPLTPEDVKAIATSLSTTAGIFNAGKTRIFDRGLKVKQNPLSIRDADLTSQMRWYLEQIARVYRVPLPMVQDWTHGTYTNSEQADLWLSKYTLAPIATSSERTAKRLFNEGETSTYVKFNLDATLRGDYATRTQGYSTLINAGVLSPNEARTFEDMDPYDGGDDYRLPLNTSTVGAEPTSMTPAPVVGTPDAATVEPRDAIQPVIDDACERIRIRATQDAERGRNPEVTRAWAEEHVLPPLLETLERLGIDASDLLTEVFSVTPKGH